MVSRLRIGFFGTPAFARTTLERLYGSRHEVALVVTQPDRPRGRGQHVTASPVKAFALERRLPVLQPERLKDDTFLNAVRDQRLDLAVVAAYGRILPPSLLDLPRIGMINVHASLLPRWRGAAPVHRAILAGDTETGVTIMRVVPALDAGPMLARATTAIDPDETSVALERRLATLGAELLVNTADRLSEGPLTEEQQDESQVTYANRLQKQESRLDWHQPAVVVHNQIRGLQPWPLATVTFHGKRLLLLESRVEPRSVDREPGTVINVDSDAFKVACQIDAVRITHVQLEGRAPVAARDFLNGHRLMVGDVIAPLPPAP